ncbi:MAG: hypothetical protein ACYC5O_24205 [Anaerolineae bacterium]
MQLIRARVCDSPTFFSLCCPGECIATVLDNLGMGHWLHSLPQGLDTELESGGGELSTGVAQLVPFVRVFLRDPGIVVLDEASPWLDPATE